jgi:hypothetical protein
MEGGYGKGKLIMTTRESWPLWQPPSETLETVTEVVAARWNAAKACYRESSFWPSATDWTRRLANAYHFARGGKLIK